jgi:hypothetical protein
MQREATIIVNEENNDASQMRFTITNRQTLTIEAPDRSMHMEIPEGGLSAMDTIDISYAFGGVGRVRGPWLAAQLNRPEFEGAAGPYVAELATLYRADTNRVAGQFILEYPRNTPQPTINPLQLHPVEDPLPGDFCVVCQNSNDEAEEWIIIGQCSLHRFHRQCVEGRFNGTSCMICRAPLRE